MIKFAFLEDYPGCCMEDKWKEIDGFFEEQPVDLLMDQIGYVESGQGKNYQVT